jgi:SAM-dependent methyltransferase
MADIPLGSDDVSGLETLRSFSSAHAFNKWLVDQIHPWCRGFLFEAGSGIGNLSKLFLDAGYPMVLSDLRPEYCEHLRNLFSGHELCRAVVEADLSEPGMEKACLQWAGRFETVVAINVIEHIRDDQAAIQNCYKLLKPEGRIVLLVPAYQALYNSFDRDLGHFRRYTRKSLVLLLEANGFRVIHSRYFNFAGLVGWLLSGHLLRYKSIPSGQLRLFNRLVPLFRWFDWITFRQVGVSVIAVGEKAA